MLITGIHKAVIFKRHPLLFPLILLSIINRSFSDAGSGNNNKDHSFVTARIGSTALIPCNLTLKQVPEDFVTLVLWYKDDMGGAPIFTIDARSRPLGSAPRVPSQELAERASFDLTTHPAFLKIAPLTKEDDGLYKCRVDYRRGRTVSTTTYLNVVVPPERIVILNNKRDEVRGSRIGLLPEDSQVKLICRTEGGRPLPFVHWIKDGSVIDDTFTTINDRSLGFVVENELVLQNLSRSDLNSVLSCEAINSNLTTRTSLTVRLELSYAPTCKEGQKLSYGASIGETIAISCDVESSPSPGMFYWLFHSSLQTSSSAASPSATAAASSATSSPVTEVIGSNGTRTASPAHSPASELSSFSAGSPSSRQDASLAGSSSKAMKSLPTSGSSTGSTASRSKTQLFTSSSRTANNQQSLGSDPNHRINNKNSGSNSLTTEHQYNNHNNHRQEQQQQQQYQQSHSSVSYSKLKYVSDGNRSWLYLTPKSKADFGTVECWATNGIGRQKNACSFTVYPAGPPEAVRDCLVHNQSSDSVLISCTPGYDGGLKQSFVLEVYERRKEQLIKNLTQDDDPGFRLESLSPKTPYAFVIYSYNMKGKSARTSVNYQITAVLPQDSASNDPSAAAAHPSSSPSSPSSAGVASSPSSGDSPSDSLNGANESRSDDGAQPSSSSSPAAASEASSLSSLLMRVALLPVLGIVSGLLLTFVLLGVIFSVLHSIRKQERSGKRAGSQSPAASSLGPVVPVNRSPQSNSPSASCDSSAAFNRRLSEIRSHDNDYGDMGFRDEESKREFLQIISSSTIQDPDLIPLGCKSLTNQGNLVRDQKSLGSLASDLVRDHAEDLLTHSSIHFIHSAADPIADVMLESGRMDSITGRTMTTDSNMTSISESMSAFVGGNGSDADLLPETVDPAGILILPVSSDGTPSELLIPRTSYQTTYQTSPAGSIGFNRHSDVRFMKSLMPTRSTSNLSFTQDLHQLHQGMQVQHQQQHHQPDHQYKQEEGRAYYCVDEGRTEFDLGLGPSQSLSRRSTRDAHLWHHPAAEPSLRDSLSFGRKSGQAVVQTISRSERSDEGCEDGCRLLTGYSTPV